MPEQLGRRVHTLEIDLGKRSMREPVRAEAGVDAFRSDVALDVDAQVIRLTRRRFVLTPFVAQCSVLLL